MAININTNPYNDDFDEFKNYYQMLFKPGSAVQARELTQLQSILRDQIKKFGNHIFQHGSVVIPGNSFSDLSAPYIKVENQFNNANLNLDLFLNKKVIGVTTGVEAIVKKIEDETLDDPVTFYVSYVKGSSSGDVFFQNGEEIYVENDTSVRATLLTSSATGVGSLAFVNTGVYYINGTFVSVDNQSVVISKYDSLPSCHVLFKISEQIIDYKQDSSLLDPAFGSYNYLAPGSDRLKISLQLTTLPIDSQINDDYVELMRFRDGVLEEHAKTPKYSELEKSLARRTFDESGNYVVSGFVPKVREHLKVDNNDGVYANGNTDLLVVEVDPGKAYINGFEVSKLIKTRIDINKARTSEHIKETDIVIRPEFGQYIIVSDFFGNFSTYSRENIDFYNDNDPLNSSATKIGSAKIISVDYLAGDVSTSNGIYKLWVTDLLIDSPYALENAGGIRYGVGKFATVLTEYTAPVNFGGFEVDELITHSSGRTATVKYWNPNTATLYAFKHDHTKDTPRVGETIQGSISGTTSTITYKNLIVSVGQSGLVFRLPKTVPYSLLNSETSSYDLQYTTQKELLIATDPSGNGSVSVSSGEQIDPIEVGTFIAIGPNGVLQNDKFSLDTPGTTLSITDGPPSSSIKIYASVEKTNVSPKTKTITTNSQVFSSPNNVITLSKTDVISITSVIDTIGDITSNYIFWNGQTDYAYKRATLTLRPGARLPVGNVTVNYSYYQHSISGDFFSIDSYAADILEKNVIYNSQSTGQVYELPACLDFRPSVGENGEFTGTNSRRNDSIISGTTFSSSLQYYVPRIDTLIIGPTGKISVITGIPNENPVAPALSTEDFALNIMFIPAYTRSFVDVVSRRLPVERYTMKKIQEISERVDRVENFMTLTSEETSMIDYQILDAQSGLDRFKTGYLVENFTDPLIMSRTTSSDWSATFVSNTLQSPKENLVCDLDFIPTNSSNYIFKNGYFMLPYREEVFAQQNLSSKVTNINPFLVIQWDGILGVAPQSDDWTEVRDLPTIFESKTEEVVVTNYIPCPPPPPPPPAPPPPPPQPAPSPSVDPGNYTDPVPTYVPPQAPSFPPPPPPIYGGLYGQVLSRAGDAGGVAHWVNDYNNAGFNVNNFLTAASANYSSGIETSLNVNKAPTVTGGYTVLTSTTDYTRNSSGQLQASVSGTYLNGKTFSYTIPPEKTLQR